LAQAQGNGPSHSLLHGMEAVPVMDEDQSVKSPGRNKANGGSSRDTPPGWKTLIIFDWDDTLLCSTAINRAALNASQLQQVSHEADAVLAVASELGETMIVTNGNGTWVDDSAHRFLPDLVPRLQSMEVISARAAWEHVHPSDPFKWKSAEFHEILQRKPSDENLNLVVIGDSPAEMQAAHSAAAAFKGQIVVKTLKFREAPSCHQLVGQLRKLKTDLSAFVIADGPASMRFEQWQVPGPMSHMGTWASSWKLAEGKDWRLSDLVFDDHWPPEYDNAAGPSDTNLQDWMELLGHKMTDIWARMICKSSVLEHNGVQL
jgi:hypothetical protein